MVERINISEQIEEVKPFWITFITDLNYTKKQAELFAKGYEEELKKLPLAEKLKALEVKYDSCMTSGFKKAGINEREAFEKANSLIYNS